MLKNSIAGINVLQDTFWVRTSSFKEIFGQLVLITYAAIVSQTVGGTNSDIYMIAPFDFKCTFTR